MTQPQILPHEDKYKSLWHIFSHKYLMRSSMAGKTQQLSLEHNEGTADPGKGFVVSRKSSGNIKLQFHIFGKKNVGKPSAGLLTQTKKQNTDVSVPLDGSASKDKHLQKASWQTSH